uniref:Uncharacterized protein n=1 Tax=Globodera pallida TaxID=36090 RepID=A0A183C0S4_GLOPA
MAGLVRHQGWPRGDAAVEFAGVGESAQGVIKEERCVWRTHASQDRDGRGRRRRAEETGDENAGQKHAARHENNPITPATSTALQFPPEGWLRIGLANTSITWLQIRPSGRLTLRAMGDCGHLGPEKVTFN